MITRKLYYESTGRFKSKTAVELVNVMKFLLS